MGDKTGYLKSHEFECCVCLHMWSLLRWVFEISDCYTIIRNAIQTDQTINICIYYHRIMPIFSNMKWWWNYVVVAACMHESRTYLSSLSYTHTRAHIQYTCKLVYPFSTLYRCLSEITSSTNLPESPMCRMYISRRPHPCYNVHSSYVIAIFLCSSLRFILVFGLSRDEGPINFLHQLFYAISVHAMLRTFCHDKELIANYIAHCC